MSRHDITDVTCPRCGIDLRGGFEAGNVDIEAAAAALAAEETVRVPIACENCGGALDLLQTEHSDDLTVDIWVEERREDESGE